MTRITLTLAALLLASAAQAAQRSLVVDSDALAGASTARSRSLYPPAPWGGWCPYENRVCKTAPPKDTPIPAPMPPQVNIPR